jgi:hypothetical protein
MGGLGRTSPYSICVYAERKLVNLNLKREKKEREGMDAQLDYERDY